MPERTVAPDQAARDRISNDLDTTLFVEAGAGSGKTTALVDRVLALVTAREVELRSIAAITFTEKAAAELRDRIRRALELRVETDGDIDVQARCAVALEQLDGAAIGTLHAFAQRLLSEHPIEAGLPPRIEVLDEVSSTVAFEKRWSVFREVLLEDPALQRSILLLVASGVRPDALKTLAMAFDDNWDLVEERVPAAGAEPPDIRALLGPVLIEIEEMCATPCRNPEDNLRQRLDDIAERMSEMKNMEDELDLLEALNPNAARKLPSFRVLRTGSKSSFDGDINEVRARVVAAGERLAAIRNEIGTACARRIGSAIRRFTLGAAEERRRDGQLEFHDLLVLARTLLRDREHGPAVRRALHDRYRHLLLDEFQDTDPIQIELAVRIAASDEAIEASALWNEVPVTPGQLFFVGDPKQSIYRFRRADISTFLSAARHFGTDGGGSVNLTANFRTVAPIIEWVNATFGQLMSEPDEIDTQAASQPRYVALDATRSPFSAGPPVAILGRDEHDTTLRADEIRVLEATEVAAAIVTAIVEGWDVGDPDGHRPARLGDITVLIPARTSLPFLEDAFDRLGIPYRAESSSLVYASRAVRDLLMVLRAVDDPGNDLHVVSALRTPLFACGDDDLFRFKSERLGRWNYFAPQPDSVPLDDPVRQGLVYLRSLHEQRFWLAPSELLDRIARDRRAFELGFAEGRPRDVWRRLRFVIDQARGWSEATGGNLREYLRWVSQQTAEGARVAESILPETDDDAVRIMTIHAAKGLEFPITIVSGTSTVPRGMAAAAEVVFPPDGSVGYKVGKAVATEEYLDWKPIDEQMGFHERIRLLYVACTRAKDHLVISVHRKTRSPNSKSTSRTNAELLLEGMGDRFFELPDAAGDPDELASIPAPEPVALSSLDDWRAERNAALTRAGRSSAVAATALTEEGEPDGGGTVDPGLQKRPRDLDLPPWVKGRYGTSVGRAVHGVLQTIDLSNPDRLSSVVAAQCEAEAVSDRRDDVEALVSAALQSPSVREAAANPHWREVYASTPIGGRLLEGYIDLLYRGPQGLVVVDYKTSGSSDPAELDQRVESYRLQGASYALTVRTATDEPVAGVTFIFLTPAGAIERNLDELEIAIDEVSALVMAGGELTVD